jgi:RecG-like helicase
LLASREALDAAEIKRQLSELPQPRAGTIPIADSRQREKVDVTGTLRAVTLRPRGPSLTMEAELWDGTGSVQLVWLGRRDIPGIQPGRKIVVHGRLTSVKGERTIFNPSYELQPTADQQDAPA